MLHFVFLDHYVDVGDYEQPIQQFLNSDILLPSTNSPRIDTYSYKVLNFNSDSGWIIEDLTKRETYQMDSHHSTGGAINPKNIYTIQVSNSYLIDVYDRHYLKVQTIMANLGGLIKILMTLATILTSYFADKLLIEDILINQIAKAQKYSLIRSNRYQSSNSHLAHNLSHLHINLSINPNVSDANVNNYINRPKLGDKGHQNYKNALKYEKMNFFRLIGCTRESRSKINKSILNTFEKTLKRALDVHSILKVYNSIKMTDFLLFSNSSRIIKNVLSSVNFLQQPIKEESEKIDGVSLLAHINNIRCQPESDYLERRLVTLFDKII